MRDESDYWEALYGFPDHDGGIRTAVHAWCFDPVAAKTRYGPIASWDTSGVTDIDLLFHKKADFNEDISCWNVSNVLKMTSTFYCASSFNGDLSSWDVAQVRSMRFTFQHATSFTCQLGGEWATSTAEKHKMFYNSPGTIAGTTKTANGSIIL